MDVNSITEEYVTEKMYEYIMASVDKYYKHYDVRSSMLKVLSDYSNILNTIKNKDENFKDFNIIANHVANNILLTTELKLKIAGKNYNYRFSCVIESKYNDEDTLQ